MWANRPRNRTVTVARSGQRSRARADSRWPRLVLVDAGGVVGTGSSSRVRRPAPELGRAVGVDPAQQLGEVGAGEPPVERRGGRVVPRLEIQQALGEDVQIGEVGRLDDLS